MVFLLIKRIGFMIFTMIVVSIILFLLLETGLAGDPATRIWVILPVKNKKRCGVISKVIISLLLSATQNVWVEKFEKKIALLP